MNTYYENATSEQQEAMEKRIHREVVASMTERLPNHRGITNYSARTLLAVYRFCKEHPTNGFIPVGDWPVEKWSTARWLAWFRHTLHRKITYANGNRPLIPDFDREIADLEYDRYIIEDFLFRRIRRSGGGNLRSKKLKARYPQVDYQTPED